MTLSLWSPDKTFMSVCRLRFVSFQTNAYKVKLCDENSVNYLVMAMLYARVNYCLPWEKRLPVSARLVQAVFSLYFVEIAPTILVEAMAVFVFAARIHFSSLVSSPQHQQIVRTVRATTRTLTISSDPDTSSGNSIEISDIYITRIDK